MKKHLKKCKYALHPFEMWKSLSKLQLNKTLTVVICSRMQNLPHRGAEHKLLSLASWSVVWFLLCHTLGHSKVISACALDSFTKIISIFQSKWKCMLSCCPQCSTDQICQTKYFLFYCELMLCSVFIIQCYILSICGKPKKYTLLPLRNDTLNKTEEIRAETKGER